MRQRAAAVVAAVAGFAAAGLGAQSAPPSLASLLAAYAQGDYVVIARSLTSDADFKRIHEQELEPAIDAWKQDRRPVYGAFVLDLALVAHNRRWPAWLDVVCLGREYLTSRRLDAASPADDAFELAWHQASVALLEGQRRPDFLLGQGLEPLARRMADADARGAGRLVTPWIELAWGRLYEQRALVGSTRQPPRNCYSQSRGRLALPSGATSMKNEGPRALRHFDEAAKFPSTKTEALVRKAWVLVQLGRAGDALAALDAIETPSGDRAFHYWRHLFRGRALAALDRADAALAAYDQALATAPGAQAPHLGALAVLLASGRREDAWRRTALVRRPADPDAVDPWWVYWSGDFRFFDERMAALRRLTR